MIPKKYVVKHFPPISEGSKENEDGGIMDDMQLFFYDRYSSPSLFSEDLNMIFFLLFFSFSPSI